MNKTYEIEVMYMRTPASMYVDETFKAYHHGIIWTITIVPVTSDGVAYTEVGTVPHYGRTRVKKYKKFVTGQYFVAKWWNHRIPQS
jgi:hypothetical protein